MEEGHLKREHFSRAYDDLSFSPLESKNPCKYLPPLEINAQKSAQAFVAGAIVGGMIYDGVKWIIYERSKEYEADIRRERER